MFRMDSKNLRSCGLAMALAFAGGAAFVPATPALAQSAPQPRSLPDFSELVDQVGPAVVNIRTVERGRRRDEGGAAGEGQGHRQTAAAQVLGIHAEHTDLS